MNERAKKALYLSARISATAAAAAVCLYLLWRYEYISQFGQIDNATGMLPVALAFVIAGCAAVLAWLKYGKPTIPVAIVCAVVLVITSALFPTALRGNWWRGRNTGNAEAEPDLSVYAPFTGEQTAVLDEAPDLTLTSDLPVIDGATAFYPIYASFAQAVFDKDAYEADPDSVRCTKTIAAYDSLIAGDVDMIFVFEPSESQRKTADDAGVELHFTPIGLEAFVFIVAESNPVDNVTSQQIRNIYSGKTSKWRTLGWKDGGDIIAFRRPEGSGSETGLQKLMGDMPTAAPRPLPDESLIGTDSLMKQVTVEWNGTQPALGYSYRFFAETMYPNPDAKLLSVDGVSPTESNIKNGTYPFVYEFYAVTRGEPTGNTTKLVEWITGGQGKELIEKTGYVAI